MAKLIRTSFEAEQKKKEEEFLKLSPLERWQHMCRVRDQMRKPGVDYSYTGKKVIVKRKS